MQITKSVGHDYSAGIKNAIHTEIYTLDMPKFIYVQVNGVEKPAKIRADKVEKLGMGVDALLSLKNGDQQIGEFRWNSVQGWWIEEETT